MIGPLGQRVMKEFNLSAEDVYLEIPEVGIAFVSNHNDGPGAYHMLIAGKNSKQIDHLYIHDRTLEDLTNPEVPVERAIDSLDQMNGHMAYPLLIDHSLRPEEVHGALLRLRVKRESDYRRRGA